MAVTVAYSTCQVAWITGSVKASSVIHASLTRSILHTTLRFLDKTPVGRIIQRFTQDIRTIDGPLSQRANNTIQLTAQVVQKMAVIVFFTPAFLVPGVALGIIGGIVAQLYIKAQLPIKRCAWRLDIYFPNF